MSRKDFISFCVTVDPKYKPAWFHTEIAERLQKAYGALLKGESTYLIIELPPRAGKSELGSIKFPAWVLGKSPEFPVIESSYALDLAQKFGQSTRDIMQSEAYQAIFGTRLREDTKAKGNWLTGAGGGYTAVGVGGPITGKGGKVIILDDVFKNREEAESETIRNKVWDWWTSTFFTRREPPTIVIIILTRWHLDDIVGRIEAQEEEMIAAGEPHIEWEYLTFPAIAEKSDKRRKKGEALWPDKFPLEELQKIQNAISVYDWASLYQQSPTLGALSEFKKEYFKYFEDEEIAKKPLDFNIYIDPAISKKKESANTAVVGVGKEQKQPYWYIDDYAVGKFDPGQLIDATFKLYGQYRRRYPSANVRVFVESVGYQKSLSYWFGEEMKRRGIYFDVEEVSTTGDKEQRIRGLIPMWKQGVIKHKAWMKELEKEALTFPKGKTVDILDALSFGIQVQENTVKAQERGKKPYVPTSPLEGGDTLYNAPMVQHTDYPLQIIKTSYSGDQRPYTPANPYEGK